MQIIIKGFLLGIGFVLSGIFTVAFANVVIAFAIGVKEGIEKWKEGKK